jgi:hypothetical protein
VARFGSTTEAVAPTRARLFSLLLPAFPDPRSTTFFNGGFSCLTRRLRPKDLHTLQTVAELGGTAKASAALGLSQPAISKAVADMELLVLRLKESQQVSGMGAKSA